MLPLRPVLDNPCLQATSSRRPKDIYMFFCLPNITLIMQVINEYNRTYVDILFRKETFQHTISIIPRDFTSYVRSNFMLKVRLQLFITKKTYLV